MIKKIVLLLLIINITFGCTKDDICSGETPTTPKLIIIFKSKINPNLYKKVDNLTVTTIVDNEIIEVIKSSTTDSIAIPLQTGIDITDFQFIKNNTSDNEGNSDSVTFAYDRDFEYINRACAFKAIYKNLLSSFVVEENWILEMSVINQTVENEDETHVVILH